MLDFPFTSSASLIYRFWVQNNCAFEIDYTRKGMRLIAKDIKPRIVENGSFFDYIEKTHFNYTINKNENIVLLPHQPLKVWRAKSLFINQN